MKISRFRLLIILYLVIFGVNMPFLCTANSDDSVVLLYHDISEVDNLGNSQMTISRDNFYAHMRYLNDNYNIISIGEYYGNLLNSGKAPHNAVMLTFDDGYESFYTYAYPILKELDIPATIFLVTDTIGTENHLTWNQIKELCSSGIITIGNHTKSHCDLENIEDNQYFQELIESKNVIEENTQKQCKFISYPYGNINDGVIEFLHQNGYSAGFMLAEEFNIESECFAHKRYMIDGLTVAEDLRKVIEFAKSGENIMKYDFINNKHVDSDDAILLFDLIMNDSSLEIDIDKNNKTDYFDSIFLLKRLLLT